jgi:hypothetical protein
MRTALTLCLCAILCGSSAWAASNSPTKQARERAAKKACATSDYRTGIDVLADLYLDTNDPTYVYNQGRCYEQNSRFAQAIERFREYLRKATDLTADDRQEVQKHVADCESYLPKTPPAVVPVPSNPPVNPAPHPQPIPSTLPQPLEVGKASAPAPTESGAGLRWAGLATAGIGVVALAVGVVLNLKHESLVNQQNTERFSRSRESDLSTYKTWSWASYGVGAAAVLAGGTTWLLGRRSNEDGQRSVALLPALGPHGAGCLLQGGF